MSLLITSLNSGSNGNCYYIGTEKEAVLIDAGISCRQVEKRLLALRLNVLHVKAVFISHEHTDHISGLESFLKKYDIPVYITPATKAGSRLRLDGAKCHCFKGHEAVYIGDLKITPFPKYHDAADPFSFVVESGGVCVGIFTDIGRLCDNVIAYFRRCHAAILEANYDARMLEDGNYPFHLKRRIRGGSGHLSNDEALQLFLDHRPQFMSHLLLGHLSKNNNRPDLVSDLFAPYAKNVSVTVASRYEQSDVFHINATSARETDSNSIRQRRANPVQLAFSFA